jgi:hypothetical protein
MQKHGTPDNSLCDRTEVLFVAVATLQREKQAAET